MDKKRTLRAVRALEDKNNQKLKTLLQNCSPRWKLYTSNFKIGNNTGWVALAIKTASRIIKKRIWIILYDHNTRGSLQLQTTRSAKQQTIKNNSRNIDYFEIQTKT